MRNGVLMKQLYEYRIENLADFNLKQIMDCGQCFRWNEECDGSYTGVVTFFLGGKWGYILANITQEDKSILIKYEIIIDEFGEDEKIDKIEGFSLDKKTFCERFWEEYFDLKRDYSEIKNFLIDKTPKMEEIIKSGEGIRILNQNKWEILISFIISQNNHIPRIKACIESLCEEYGKYLGDFFGKKRYGFPTPQELAALTRDEINVCKLGYRDEYILESSRQVLDIGMKQYIEIEKFSDEEALVKIRGFRGVGPKVANCIVLFAFKKVKSFPVDVHIKRAMKNIFGLEGAEEIEKFVSKRFGKYAGIAQQYLFYHIRKK